MADPRSTSLLSWVLGVLAILVLAALPLAVIVPFKECRLCRGDGILLYFDPDGRVGPCVGCEGKGKVRLGVSWKQDRPTFR